MKTIFLVVTENMTDDIKMTVFSDLKGAMEKYESKKLSTFERFKWLLQSEEGKEISKSFIDRKPEPFEGAKCLHKEVYVPIKVGKR